MQFSILANSSTYIKLCEQKINTKAHQRIAFPWQAISQKFDQHINRGLFERAEKNIVVKNLAPLARRISRKGSLLKQYKLLSTLPQYRSYKFVTGVPGYTLVKKITIKSRSK